jgi:hypothetical protein
MTRYLLLFDSYGLVFEGRPLWREDGYVFSVCWWPLPAQSLSGPSPLVLATIFYCIWFETSIFVSSYDSQSHGGGIRPRLNTGWTTNSLFHTVLLITSRYGTHKSTVSIVIVQQCLDRCIEMGVCLSAHCIETAVLVRFEVSAQQRVYTPKYDNDYNENMFAIKRILLNNIHCINS